MTNHAAVLRELMVAGYEGAALLAAFERMLAAISSSTLQEMQITRARTQSPVREKRTQPDVVATFDPGPAPENAKAIGQKALNQAGLSSAAVAVGSQLLEHLNLRTGRCDPSRSRLAEKAGVTVRSVHRAVGQLEAAGLFVVDRHGGLGNRSAFQANWQEMQRLVALGENMATGQKSPVGGDRNVRQNQLRKPDSLPSSRKPQRAKPVDRRQGNLILPIAGGRDTGSASVAREEARKRLWAGVTDYAAQLDRDGKAAIYLAFNDSPDIEDAVSREQSQRGSGVAWMLRRLLDPPGRATG